MLTRLASTIGSVGCSRSNKRPHLVGGPWALVQDPRHGRILALQLPGDARQVRRPRLDRVRRVGLRVEHRLRLVDQGGQRVEILAGVDRQVGSAGDEPAQFRPESADRDVGLVDDGLQVVARDRLQTAVRHVQHRVDVGRDRGAVARDDVAVLQHRPSPLRGSSCDVLLADRGHAVHLGFEVGGDLDVRLQRQHRRDTGVGQLDALHVADLDAAVGDVAPAGTARRSRAAPRSRGTAPTPNSAGSRMYPKTMIASAVVAITAKIAIWMRICRVRSHVTAPGPSGTERSTGCRRCPAPPAMHGLGNWPMVRPHCSSSQVRSHSHRVPVKNPESIRLNVRSTINVRFA